MIHKLSLRERSLSLVLRGIVICYTILLTLFHTVIWSSVIIQRLLEIQLPGLSTIACCVVLALHLQGFIRAFFCYSYEGFDLDKVGVTVRGQRYSMLSLKKRIYPELSVRRNSLDISRRNSIDVDTDTVSSRNVGNAQSCREPSTPRKPQLNIATESNFDFALHAGVVAPSTPRSPHTTDRFSSRQDLRTDRFSSRPDLPNIDKIAPSTPREANPEISDHIASRAGIKDGAPGNVIPATPCPGTPPRVHSTNHFSFISPNALIRPALHIDLGARGVAVRRSLSRISPACQSIRSAEPIDNYAAQIKEEAVIGDLKETIERMQHWHNAAAIIGQFIQTYRAYVISSGITTTFGPKLISLSNMAICIGIIVFYSFKLAKSRLFQIMLTRMIIFAQIICGVLIPILILSSPVVALIQDPSNLTNRNWFVVLLSEGRLFAFASSAIALGQLYPLIHAYYLFNFLDQVQELNKIEASHVRRRHSVAHEDDYIGDEPAFQDTSLWDSSHTRKWVNRVYILGICYSLLLLCVAFTADLHSSCETTLGSTICVRPIYPWFPKAGACQCLSVKIDCNELHEAVGWNTSEVYEFVDTKLIPYFTDRALRLQINQCEFQNFPSSIDKLQELLWIDILRGHLLEWNLNVAKKPHLLTLLVKYQPIVEYPLALTRLPPSLMIFVIAHTQIQEMPKWDKSTESGLLWFGAYSNQFKDFPLTVTDISSIKRLILHNNSITAIPKGIARMKNLNVLMMESNRLETIDPGITAMPALNVIKLDGNNLSRVPWEAQHIIEWNADNDGSGSQVLSNARMLSLGHNPICSSNTKLSASRACIKNCSPMCSPYYLKNTECNLQCNTRECEYDNGYCLNQGHV